MGTPRKDITKSINQTRFKFSICSLVTDFELYDCLFQSFQNNGFSENCEFLYIDNSKENNFDAYSGIRHFINCANGEYIIICHQDIELIEQNYNDLVNIIENLNNIAPNWGIAGNAGYDEKRNLAIRISDRFGYNQYFGPLPRKVTTLDENFLIIPNNAKLMPSIDLKGFHLYGTDLCIQAHIKGQSAWVIDFHLFHRCGKLRIDQSYFQCLKQLEDKYNKTFSTRWLITTCSHVFLSSSKFELFLMRLKRLPKKIRLKIRQLFYIEKQV